jgi:Universal stress protein family
MKSILVPIDLSDVTQLVLDQAKQIAQVFGAAIHLVHVKEITPVTPPTTFGYGFAGMPELMPMSTAPASRPGCNSTGVGRKSEGETCELAKRNPASGCEREPGRTNWCGCRRNPEKSGFIQT